MHACSLAVIVLLRHCIPTGECQLQSSQRAQTLLENMHFFSVAHTLLAYGQGEAVVTVMMRFVEAAAALGEPFFRWLRPRYISSIKSKTC